MVALGAKKTKSGNGKKENKLSEKAQRTHVLSGPVIVDGLVHFSPYDLARFELVQHKVANMRQALLLKRSEQLTLQHGYEVTSRKLREEEVQIEALLRVKEQEWKQLRDELQGLYKLNFDELTYDDTTGLLKVHGELVLSKDSELGSAEDPTLK
jgi:hypothetical protein